MPVRVPLTHSITNFPLQGANDSLFLDNENGTTVTYQNPFHNLLEMVRFYLDIYKNEDIEKLLDFVSYAPPYGKPKIISHLDMYQCFVCPMYWASMDPVGDDPWMTFDHTELDALLKDPFFDEYRESLPYWQGLCHREYPMLDVYAFVALEADAATKLPKDKLWDINYIWTFEDFIDILMGFRWYKLISIVYQVLGIHWFAEGGARDPIKYKWACEAVEACKRSGMVDDASLKKDLAAINQELIIAFTIRNTLEENKDIMDYVQDCITNFNEDKIAGLSNKIKELEQERGALIDKNKQLTDGMQVLRKQFEELQKTEADDEEKLAQMEEKLNSLSPQTPDMDEHVKKFSAVWDKLDQSTKKDIKLSISMFQQFDSFDLALFPMIRSLEHEMARNFFNPFAFSKDYREIGTPYCDKKRYEKTHEALIYHSGKAPTMGNIPFIGRAMTDAKAQEASNLIKAFRVFLGDERKPFVSICKGLDSYRVGAQKFRLVDIRNGIAHGDDDVTTQVDKACYEEASKLLYEPPAQILFEVIYHSKRK